MKILAFDISSVSTGVALVEDGYFSISDCFLITPDKKQPLGQRLLYFEKQVEKYIKKYQPDEIICEEIFRGPNTITFKILARLQGIAIKTIYEKTGKDPLLIMAVQARKLVGCGAKKEDAFNYIVNKYHLKSLNFDEHNDIVDAITLGLAACIFRKTIHANKKSIRSSRRSKRRNRRRHKKSI